jgi:outer membrane receptor protein involved in Fe transport
LPSARVSFEFENRPRVWLTYNTSTQEPSVQQLQPVADVRSPQFTSIGNPDLQPEFTHSVSARVLHFDSFAFTNLFAFARASYTPTAITTSRTVDERLRELVRPVNAGEAWSMQGSLSYERPIRPLAVTVSVGGNGLVRRTTELLNGEDNVSDLTRYGVNLSLENRRKETFDVEAGARFDWSQTAYELRPQFDQDYLTRSFFARGLVTVGAFEFETDVDYALYPAELSGTRRALPRWNATAIWQAMPKMRVELAAADLLDQGLAIDYTETGVLVREERTESLGRYLLLRLTYEIGAGGRSPFGR